MIYDKFLPHPDTRVREEVCECLLRLKKLGLWESFLADQELGTMCFTIIRKLVTLLRDHDFCVRNKAVEGLLAIGTRDTIKQIVPLLQCHEDFIRSASLDVMIGILGFGDVVSMLVERFKRSKWQD